MSASSSFLDLRILSALPRLDPCLRQAGSAKSSRRYRDARRGSWDPTTVLSVYLFPDQINREIMAIERTQLQFERSWGHVTHCSEVDLDTQFEILSLRGSDRYAMPMCAVGYPQVPLEILSENRILQEPLKLGFMIQLSC